MHSIFLILSRAPVNRGLPSVVGADNARWHTPRPIVRARWILVLWPRSGLPSIVEKKQQKTKTLTDDCSALYWTQELGLTCLESGRRAASNEPSCFSRRWSRTEWALNELVYLTRNNAAPFVLTRRSEISQIRFPAYYTTQFQATEGHVAAKRAAAHIAQEEAKAQLDRTTNGPTSSVRMRLRKAP